MGGLKKKGHKHKKKKPKKNRIGCTVSTKEDVKDKY